MKTIIHVNQHVIRRNTKTGSNDPAITVRTYKGTERVHAVEVQGPCRLVSSPHKPLPCGARIWLETEASVRVLD